ncbi:MAG: SAM-dependent methyltransferase [Candidatus Saccharibacteria bacterium]|nr:SAM-dependent methyltransferase [Candidatus Saccharibacteria bacterium]
MSEWTSPELAKSYAESALSSEVNWYEHQVNLPAELELIPALASTILDFGCGAGDVTRVLAQKYPRVEGADLSETMLAMAKQESPTMDFFMWDGTIPLSEKQSYYDVVFSKLALHFVEDLVTFASNVHGILKPGGSLIFSVPHPMSTTRKANGEYWQQAPYNTEIGTFGVQVTMIHRSLQSYAQPFVDNRFVLTALQEPRISEAIAQKYQATETDVAIPKRLNLRFEKAAI